MRSYIFSGNGRIDLTQFIDNAALEVRLRDGSA